jgi:hypothetical protein
MKNTLLGLVFLIGCGGDGPPPSCADAFGHFYGAGCTFVDASTGQPFPMDEIISQCQSLAANAPANCRDELNTWVRCIEETSASKNCDCSAEQMALLECR